MQAQEHATPATGPPPLSALYGGLSDFSSLLTNALGTIDQNVTTLQTSSINSQEQIQNLRQQVEKYGAKLQMLEAEAAEQRAKVERAMLNVTDMGKNIDNQLTETTKQMHRELLTQRTSTKMDLFTLGGNIRKSMNEAMDLIAESPKLLKSTGSAAHNPNSSNEESIKFLLDKLTVIEEALMIQHSVNLQLSESVKNDEMVRKVYDSLYDQISHLEVALQQANTQNQELKDKNRRELDKMRDAQNAQQAQITQLIGALMSTKNMKKFKQTMSRVAEADVEDPQSFVPSRAALTRSTTAETAATKPTTATAGANEPIAEEKDVVLSADEDEEETRQRRKSAGKRRRQRRRRHSDSESDEEDAEREGKARGEQEEGGDEEDGDDGDRFDEREGSRHATVKTRHHHHHHHHRTTVKETVVVKEAAAAPAGEAPAEETTSAKQRKPTEVRRNKTFNSGTKKEAAKEEKETQTPPKPTTASTGANTDNKGKPAPTPGAPEPAPTLPVQADGKIVFDDEGSLGTEQKEQFGEAIEPQPSHDSLDESYSYYDSDSYYSVSVRGGVTAEQLEAVAAAARAQVEDLRGEYVKRVDELEEAVLTFKRIALMMEDMKINYDQLKAKVDNVSGVSTGTVGNFDDMRATSQYHSIQHAKMLWAKVHAELLFGLEKYSENDSDAEGDASVPTNVSEGTKNSRLFVKKAAALVGYLDSNLAAFHPAETVAATLKTVHPTLEHIYKQAMELDALDEAIRQSAGMTEGCYFDALTCSDESHDLKSYVKDAMSASVPVLDESIPKVAMRQRLEALERQLRDKVDKNTLKGVQDEMKTIAKAKVDVKEFQASISKLATAAELAKLNLYVADIGGRGSGAGYSNTRSDSAVDMERAELSKNADFQGLLQRFDMLGKQQLDLHNFCASFVPREEVHEAMKAVIGEVKALKQNTVNHTLFRDGLKTKADTAEVERVVKAITEAVGDLNINSADAAAAVHAKCLICDKPVTATGRARTALAGAGAKSRSMVSSSMPLLGYSKAMDDSSVHSGDHDKQMFNRLTSQNPAVSQGERVKVATELAILRSSIEPLPEINDPSNNHSESTPQSAGHYKQRIRHSAGGGVGPNYKKDTR